MFLAAKEEIELLRNAIAGAFCPLKLGETITIVDGEKEHNGVIDHIGPATTFEELLDPVIGAETGWAASGQRINKTTSQLGSWSFEINSFEAELVGGKWVVKRRTLEDF
jgi:hypothetical protein